MMDGAAFGEGVAALFGCVLILLASVVWLVVALTIDPAWSWSEWALAIIATLVVLRVVGRVMLGGE